MPGKNKKIIYSLFLLLAVLLLPTVVFAAGEVPQIGMFASIFGEATLSQIIIRIIQFFLAALGIIVLGLLLYAGFNWMTSQGDPNKIEKAKQTIYQAIVGLIIIFSAFAVTSFIFSYFGPSASITPEPCAGADCPVPPDCIGLDCEYLDPYNLLPPEITYIDPAFDREGDTNRSKITTSTVDDDISNGAKGNLITIYGRYFGSQKGKVYFVDRATNARIEADAAPCEKSWTSNQIIVLVPTAGITANGVTVDSGVPSADSPFNYEVIVIKNPIGANPLESLPRGFQVNQIERPGICSMVPKSGIHPATTTISGLKFPTSGTQNVIWKITPYTVTSTGSAWSNVSTVGVIPDGVHGKSLVTIFNGTVSSNFYAFMISDGKINSPCGFDTRTCREDLDTCVISGLVCAENCTCQPPLLPDSCVYNADPASNAKRDCTNGGCSGKNYCDASGVYSKSCTLDNPACIPYLGNRSSIASFSWSFNAFKPTGVGSSCSSDTWGDDSCDLNGCIDATGHIDPKLYCETESIPESLTASSTEPCTCLPKSNLCSLGDVDSKTCPLDGSCEQVRKCTEAGIYGICEKANTKCIPYLLRSTSTIASYSWSFGASNGDIENGPMVVSACDGSTDCSQNRLPSPAPWDYWTPQTASGVQNTQACLNATIYARFTKAMDSATLNTDNIKLYKLAGESWTDVSSLIAQISPRASGDIGIDSFNVQLKSGEKLDAASSYRIFLNKNIRDALGRNLIDNPAENGVNQGLCSIETSAGLPADPGVCWSFETRPSNDKKLICDVGCVNCGPNQYFNRYYGEKQDYNAYPISLDNSCIMLNATNYAWDWTVENQDPGGAADKDHGWNIMTDIKTAYSWLFDLLGNPITAADGIFNQSAGTPVSGMATTTALRESRWRTNAGYSSWFGADDHDYFAVRPREVATKNSGICKVHNDFTDPIVIESEYCSKSDDPAHRILQSPSPWKGQTNACINAVIFALFSRNMLNKSLIADDGTFKNFEIYKCDTASAATSSSYATRGANCHRLETGWTAKIFNHTNQGLSLQDLIDYTNIGTDDNSIKSEGIRIFPPLNTKLDVNSWYKVIIHGEIAGVRGGTSTPEVAEGVLQVPSPNARLTNPASNSNWYYWYFKTGYEDCPIDQIAVLPQVDYMPTVGEKQDYSADPYAANCNHLNPYSYIWQWDSLINPFTALERCSGTKPDSGDTVATICEQGSLNCAASPAHSTTSPEATAFSQSFGHTYITASAEQYSACADNKYGTGELQVGNLGFSVSHATSTPCVNTDVSVYFTQNAKSVTFNHNISLYECPAGSADCRLDSNPVPVPTDIAYPEGFKQSPLDPNPVFSNKAIVKPRNDLIAGKAYRVVVKGGSRGVKSYLDAAMTGLNYNFATAGGGEACDPTVYPWRTGDPGAELCFNNCLYKSASNLCGITFAQCTTTASTVGNAGSYCNSLCHDLGNINVASCGNGKLEPGEDCDDGNTAGNDGCSSRCKLEGSNSKYGSVCGNGKIEKGENCDDGNTIDTDSCNAKCLLTVNTNAGSDANGPICGNGRIEFGEECDDGSASNGARKRCSNHCLLSGSISKPAGTCGNNILDNGQFDSYSWTFTLPVSAGICLGPHPELNPCPNGVWSAIADSAVDQFSTKIYKGFKLGDPAISAYSDCKSDAEMQKIGFWRRIFNELVRIVKSFLGFRSVIAADMWCPISDESFSSSDLAQMRLGNYHRRITINNAANDTEVIGYTDDTDNYKVNFIRSNNWALSTQFKMVMTYDKDGIKGTSTASVMTYPAVCQLRNVKFDVWPRGATKQADAFFCASDPATGKPDECGRFSDGLYDDDMSASWTMRQPGNGYNLTSNGTAQTIVTADYRGGNNHLYRVWPTGDIAGSDHDFVLRGVDFNTNLLNINTRTTSSPVTSTDYSGDFWMTSSFNPGRSIFDVVSVTGGAGTTDTAKGNLPIYTYFCNNPWPDAGNFPFIDSGSTASHPAGNCKSGNGDCINTNFATYYCRDAGVEKTCVKGDANKIGQPCANNASCWTKPADSAANPLSCQNYMADDLPSIGNYDAVTNQFGPGTAVIKGNTGDTNCATLPAGFSVSAAYYSSTTAEKVAYLWGQDGSVYKGRYAGGWVKVDKGDWQRRGLPANFMPKVGYTLDDKTYLWDASGKYLVFDNGSWLAASRGTGLPADFIPVVGYVDSVHQIQLWDKNGVAMVSSNATSWIKVTPKNLPVGFKPTVGYYQNNSRIWDKDGNYYRYTGGQWTQSTAVVDKAGLPANFKPAFGYYDGQTSVVIQGSKSYQWSGSAWAPVASVDRNCDNKMKEFLFSGIPDFGSVSSGDKSNAVMSLKGSDGTVAAPAVAYPVIFDAGEGSATIKQGYASGEKDVVYDLSVASAGNYFVSLESSNNAKSTTLPAGFAGSYGSCQQGINLSGNQLYQQVEVLVDGVSASVISALASSPESHQFNRLSSPISLSAGNHTISLRFLNDCSCYNGVSGSACPQGDIDSNLKVYSIFFNRADSSAIGLRVYNNNNHYSPTMWYVNRFFPNLGDNLTKLSVDGYGAAQEGRTTYINAADYNNGATSVYSNMYLLSYSQGAGSATVNIYNQLLANMFFNAGGYQDGGLEYGTALNYCSEGLETADNVCFSDIDCVKRNAGYCKSIKGKITRDTQRLSDLQTIYSAMSGYYNKLRCSTDFTRGCNTNADCLGGGACGNFYPNLRAGTYITGKTFSAWPSWQDNLAKEFGVSLPVDPINKLWAWDSVNGKSVNCTDPFNSVTCWDQTSKQMVNNNGVCNISHDSAVYAYYGTKTGTSTRIYAKGEADPTGNMWRPNWQYVANLQYKPFDGYNALMLGNQFCSNVSDTCGNGVWNTGENCSNCPTDNSCPSGQSCQRSGANWGCANIKNCADNVLQPGEECIGGNLANGDGCDNNCQLESGYIAIFGRVVSVCGDGFKTADEECEFKNGVSQINNLPVTVTHIGALACTDQCKIADWYKPIFNAGKVSQCGDGLKTDQEACDCGTAGTTLGLPFDKSFNVFNCPSLNRDKPTAYSNASLKDYPYCDISCQRHDGQYYYCGDGINTNGGNSPWVTDWVDWYGANNAKCAAVDATDCKIKGEVCDPTNASCHNPDYCNSRCTGLISGITNGGCNPLIGCCWKPKDTYCDTAAGELPSCDSDCKQCNAGDACCDGANCSRIVNGTDGAGNLCGDGTAIGHECDAYPGTAWVNPKCGCSNGLSPLLSTGNHSATDYCACIGGYHVAGADCVLSCTGNHCDATTGTCKATYIQAGTACGCPTLSPVDTGSSCITCDAACTTSSYNNSVCGQTMVKSDPSVSSVYNSSLVLTSALCSSLGNFWTCGFKSCSYNTDCKNSITVHDAYCGDNIYENTWETRDGINNKFRCNDNPIYLSDGDQVRLIKSYEAGSQCSNNFVWYKDVITGWSGNGQNGDCLYDNNVPNYYGLHIGNDTVCFIRNNQKVVGELDSCNKSGQITLKTYSDGLFNCNGSSNGWDWEEFQIFQNGQFIEDPTTVKYGTTIQLYYGLGNRYYGNYVISKMNPN